MSEEPQFSPHLVAQRDLLISMLLSRGLAEAVPGYGHATADDVADAVMEWIGVVGRAADRAQR